MPVPLIPNHQCWRVKHPSDTTQGKYSSYPPGKGRVKEMRCPLRQPSLYKRHSFPFPGKSEGFFFLFSFLLPASKKKKKAAPRSEHSQNGWHADLKHGLSHRRLEQANRSPCPGRGRNHTRLAVNIPPTPTVPKYSGVKANQELLKLKSRNNNSWIPGVIFRLLPSVLMANYQKQSDSGTASSRRRGTARCYGCTPFS